jgi:hypothetical protein
VFFLCSLVGVFAVFMRHRRGESALFTQIMVFWFLATLYASMKGVRFALFLSVPTMICFSVALVDVTKKMLTWAQEISQLRLRYALLFAAAFAAAYTVHAPAMVAYEAAQRQYPLMDDTWYTFLTKIKEKTEQNAILMSWWDFGDWYKTVADRRVTFDGQSQHTNQSHWMGRALMSEDMSVSRRLLTMMRRARYYMYDDLVTLAPDPYERYALLERYVRGDKRAAAKIEPQFIENAPGYVIVEHTMLPKMGAISFLGNWDVPKLYLSRHSDDQNAVLNVTKIFGVSSAAAELKKTELAFAEDEDTQKEVYSTRYIYSSQEYGKEDGGMLYFSNGFVCSKDASTARFYTREKGYGVPSFVCIFDGKSLQTRRFSPSKDEKISGGMIVSRRSDGTWWCTAVSHEVAAKSLFARLYFYGGFGVDFVESVIADEEHGMFMYRLKN